MHHPNTPTARHCPTHPRPGLILPVRESAQSRAPASPPGAPWSEAHPQCPGMQAASPPHLALLIGCCCGGMGRGAAGLSKAQSSAAAGLSAGNRHPASTQQALAIAWHAPCSRVFTTSSGCRMRLEVRPAAPPASACFLQGARQEKRVGGLAGRVGGGSGGGSTATPAMTALVLVSHQAHGCCRTDTGGAAA